MVLKTKALEIVEKTQLLKTLNILLLGHLTSLQNLTFFTLAQNSIFLDKREYTTLIEKLPPKFQSSGTLNFWLL